MNIDKIMGKIVPPKGASLAMQRKWQGFSPATKIKLRNKLRDSDRDGVPNMFDCQPFNRWRQEADDICPKCKSVNTTVINSGNSPSESNFEPSTSYYTYKCNNCGKIFSIEKNY